MFDDFGIIRHIQFDIVDGIKEGCSVSVLFQVAHDGCAVFYLISRHVGAATGWYGWCR